MATDDLPTDESLPTDDQVDEEIIEPEFVEYDGRMYAIAAIVPHPTAIRVIMELGDGDEVVHRRVADLVVETRDPVFWVVTYAEALAAYTEVARGHVQSAAPVETFDPDSDEAVGQSMVPDSPLGRTAHQLAAGLRAMAGSLAEGVLAATTDDAWSADAAAQRFVLLTLTDALLAAGILEQLNGQPAIPPDVLAAWESARGES